MLHLLTTSPADTRDVAAALAELVRGGDLIVLTGDLGAGKTAFTKGFGAALGVTEPITSPTFTLVRHYEGRLRLHHLDVYRLDQLDEVADLGLEELIDADAVTVIEWGDQISPALPQDYLEIIIELGDGDDDRRFHLRHIGSGWAPRITALSRALAAWAEAAGHTGESS